jgi:hypothetical protein
MNLKQAKEVLVGCEGTILKEISRLMTKRKFAYETFGKDIEMDVVALIEKKFCDNGHNQFRRALNKNDFPELTVILSDGQLAIDIKAGNHCKKKGTKWCSCSNSNNDLGTIRSWPEKLRKFGGENIYFVFVEYCINDTTHELRKITIAPFYMFLDVNSSGLLKYREKDGHLRPRNFNAKPVITSMAKFNALFRTTEIQRSKNIMRQHIKNIPKSERAAFLNELKSD